MIDKKDFAICAVMIMLLAPFMWCAVSSGDDWNEYKRMRREECAPACAPYVVDGDSFYRKECVCDLTKTAQDPKGLQ